jgi:hypothetical protein
MGRVLVKSGGQGENLKSGDKGLKSGGAEAVGAEAVGSEVALAGCRGG